MNDKTHTLITITSHFRHTLTLPAPGGQRKIADLRTTRQNESGPPAFLLLRGPAPLRLLVIPRPSARRPLCTRTAFWAFYSFLTPPQSPCLPFPLISFPFIFLLTSVIGAGAVPTPHPPSPHLSMPPFIRARCSHNGPLRKPHPTYHPT